MFRIIRDEEEARLFLGAGLLWWVSAEDGGNGSHLTITCRYGCPVIDSHVQSGVVGIRVED